MMKRILLIFLSIVSIFLFINAPWGYSIMYIWFCTIVYLTSSIVMLCANCKYTFIKFELFFFIAFFYTNYVYPLIYYPVSPYFSLFRIPFNELYITKGTALATVAISFFNLGIFEPQPVNLTHKIAFNVKKHLLIPRITIIILFLLFLPSLYSIYQSHSYSTEFESSYVNAILKYLVLYSIFAFIYNHRYNPLKSFLQKSFRIPIIIFIFIYTILFLLIGSRTIPLNIVLFSLLLINVLIYKISKQKASLFIIIGSITLTAIGIDREGSGTVNGDITSFWDLGADLTINNRSLYVLMEEADENGITYGSTMMMNALSAIPFAQSFYLNYTGQELSKISSANLVTELGTNNPHRFGLGTNLVGDVYVAFGLTGIIVLFWFLGFIIKRLCFGISRGKTLALLIYALLFMNSIYYTRSGYLTPVRDIVWILGIYWLSNIRIWKK